MGFLYVFAIVSFVMFTLQKIYRLVESNHLENHNNITYQNSIINKLIKYLSIRHNEIAEMVNDLNYYDNLEAYYITPYGNTIHKNMHCERIMDEYYVMYMEPTHKPNISMCCKMCREI